MQRSRGYLELALSLLGELREQARLPPNEGCCIEWIQSLLAQQEEG